MEDDLLVAVGKAAVDGLAHMPHATYQMPRVTHVHTSHTDTYVYAHIRTHTHTQIHTDTCTHNIRKYARTHCTHCTHCAFLLVGILDSSQYSGRGWGCNCSYTIIRTYAHTQIHTDTHRNRCTLYANTRTRCTQGRGVQPHIPRGRQRRPPVGDFID